MISAMPHALVPVLFVLLWSTGFIGAKFGLPYSEPLTFLLIRFLLVIMVLGAVALLLGRPWPRSGRAWRDTAVAGVLIHGGYLSGVFSAIHHGMSAGAVALIVGLQPLLTAVAAGLWFGEKVRPRQWIGLALGFVGVALVVSGRIGGLGGVAALALALMALVSITAGTLWQKRHGGEMDLWTGSIIQFAAAGAVLLPFALAFETMQVQWTGRFVFALGWLVLVLSVGAISLLFLLIRRGEATRVSALFYLTPPVTALMAWGMFGETLRPLALAGMVLAVAGVWLAVRK